MPPKWQQEWRRRGFFVLALVLAALGAVVVMVPLGRAYWWHEAAVRVAGVVCLVGAFLAMLRSDRSQET